MCLLLCLAVPAPVLLAYYPAAKPCAGLPACDRGCGRTVVASMEVSTRWPRPVEARW